MTKYDYWDECIAISFGENGITATEDQIKAVAADVQGAHENYGQAFYRPSESPLKSEVEKLKRELRDEREKVWCKDCRGTGRIIIPGPYHSGESQCSKCRGEGRHKP